MFLWTRATLGAVPPNPLLPVADQRRVDGLGSCAVDAEVECAAEPKPPARRRGPYAKTAERRQEILQTALEVFGESGYRGSSFREIAARVGLTDTGVAHHFGGKGKLLLEVLKQRELADRAFVAATSIRDPFGRGLVARNGRTPGVIRLFATLSAESTDSAHPAHGHFVQRYATMRRTFAARLRNVEEAPIVAADIDPDIAARLVIAVMDGLQIQWLLDPSQDMSVAYDDFVKRYFGDTSGPD